MLNVHLIMFFKPAKNPSEKAMVLKTIKRGDNMPTKKSFLIAKTANGNVVMRRIINKLKGISNNDTLNIDAMRPSRNK